jgi:alkaline phosphatase D
VSDDAGSFRGDSAAEVFMASSRTAQSRRRFVASASAAVLGGAIAPPAISRAGQRPIITHGTQSGDVGRNSGVIWARADRPARMLVEVAATESFRHVRHRIEVDALPDTDFSAKALIEDLPAGQEIFYRVRFQDLHAPWSFSEAALGRFRTAPSERRSVSFVWSGDTAGQGWGIDETRGGMRGYAAIRQNRPDFFIHCGDSIYADCPIEREIKLANGEIWKNLVTEEKSKVAETLTEFRGNYKYNLMDRNVRACNAEVPLVALWDDHEVFNDWYPGQIITAGAYHERSATLIAARANRAFREFMPMRESPAESGRVYRRLQYGPLLDVFLLDMRSYRDPNGVGRTATEGPGTALLGSAQVAWLKRTLLNSQATWKVIAADLPLGLVSEDAVAQGDGPPLGREIEIADILAFISREGIHNVVWITADMHYTAAHYYDPNRAVFQDFEPFWEFVSGPLHAGTWAPSQLDNTFGPRVMFQKGCTAEQGENLPPCFGLQFFGHAAIDTVSGVLTMTLKDLENRALWSVAIEPKHAQSEWDRV